MQWIRYDDNDVQTCTTTELGRLLSNADGAKLEDLCPPPATFKRQTYSFQVCTTPFFFTNTSYLKIM
jgi:hypothetical protein